MLSQATVYIFNFEKVKRTKSYSGQGLCPLKTEIARLPTGFRLDLFLKE